MLLRLLAAPVTGPIRGIVWVAQYAVEEAERQNHARIVRELDELEQARANGEISDEELEAAEDALLAQLVDSPLAGPEGDRD